METLRACQTNPMRAGRLALMNLRALRTGHAPGHAPRIREKLMSIQPRLALAGTFLLWFGTLEHCFHAHQDFRGLDSENVRQSHD